MELKQTVIGIELGSTRIKAVLLDKDNLPAASGSYEWENKLVDGIWTYSMEMVHRGLRECFEQLRRDVMEKYAIPLTTTGAIGISGMMHGYLPFDKNGNQLAEFRTWRNTITAQAAEELSSLFAFNIPQRWSIAHLYQAILNGEEHIRDIAHITTLAGYIHYRLTGRNVIGIGEASGMFPIDSNTLNYNSGMVKQFDELTAEYGFDWRLSDVLPAVAVAGEEAGRLTREGALFLDPSGTLEPGIPFAPCEGDAGTGMTATNSVRENTGNVSAGTSDFAMLVLNHEIGAHKEIDMVTTPSGKPVAMVHCNNCTSDINAWVLLFSELAEYIGAPQEKGKMYTMLFEKALEGDCDCGGLLNYNYFSGEGITGFDEGRLVLLRRPDCKFNLANFMRNQLYSSLATLKIGLDILTDKENVRVDKIYGHGGFFKTPEVGQRMLSAAINAPVYSLETAGEGGPYGMALLAAYMLKGKGETLEDYLDNAVFKHARSTAVMAGTEEIRGFEKYLRAYQNSLPVEAKAIETWPMQQK